MDRRVFAIDEKCFIIYTGKSSADNQSFLRIGNSNFVTKEIQTHIRHVVVNDATLVDFNKEKENIRFMQQGKISYICNKVNQDILFNGLSSFGVDIDNLFHQDLSDEIDNINRIENKKHFFTIFYDNKNVKLVFNEEIFFDLFSSLKQSADYEAERLRLKNLINILDKLYLENRNVEVDEDFISKGAESTKLDFPSTSLFFVQDNIYFPLGLRMFNIKKNDEGFIFNFNCSQRFYIGRDVSLYVLEKGEKKFELSGILIEGEVLESDVLYKYRAAFVKDFELDFNAVLKFYKQLINRSNIK
jgi:hypothetical protein